MGRQVTDNKKLIGCLNFVAMYVKIPKFQDEQINKIVRATGKHKGLVVSEALVLGAKKYHKMGVI